MIKMTERSQGQLFVLPILCVKNIMNNNLV